MKLSGRLGAFAALLVVLSWATSLGAQAREPISISVKDGVLADVLRPLARVGGFNRGWALQATSTAGHPPMAGSPGQQSAALSDAASVT